MSTILIAGAGGAPSEGVINSLLKCSKKETIFGMGSEPTDLVLSSAHKKILVPYANEKAYPEALSRLLDNERIDLIHFQNDLEIFHASLLREMIHQKGVKTFMPNHDVIDICVNKYKTYLKWKNSNIKIPENILINNESDLVDAFKYLANEKGEIWLRASSIGGGGKGALPTSDFEFAKRWIERFEGWGDFIAAQMLQKETVTWQSIWHEGKLIIAQTRKRRGWTHGNRTLSGVTGVTKIGQTFSDTKVDDIAHSAILSIDKKPHGIYGVDMAYDFNGIPNPTEINISRFFTTILFFTEAGLNMPKIFKDIILYGEFPKLKKTINPLPDNLLWLRGMDTKPRLMNEEQLDAEIIRIS